MIKRLRKYLNIVSPSLEEKAKFTEVVKEIKNELKSKIDADHRKNSTKS